MGSQAAIDQDQRPAETKTPSVRRARRPSRRTSGPRLQRRRTPSPSRSDTALERAVAALGLLPGGGNNQERTKGDAARSRFTRPGVPSAPVQSRHVVPVLGGDELAASNDSWMEMLRRFSWVRVGRPRFPEGEIVPWGGIVFAGATLSLAHNSAALALAAFTTSLLAQASAGLPPVPRALVLLGAIGCYAWILTGADALFGYFARGGTRPQLPMAALVAEAPFPSIGVGFAPPPPADPWRGPFAPAPFLFL